MQVSNAYPVYYLGNNALRPDTAATGANVDSSRHHQQLKEVQHRPPAEQVLEGELLDKQRQQQRQQTRAGVYEDGSPEQQRYQQQAASRALASSLTASQALAEYQENAELSAGSIIRERALLLDVYA